MRLFIAIALIFLATLALSTTAAATNAKHYIVYMGHHSHPDSESVIIANHKMLASAHRTSDEVKPGMVHHYSRSFRGFSAMLTPQQAHRLSGMDDVVSVFESRVYEIHTTHSWEFLGLGSNTFYQNSQVGYGATVFDVVVGVVDTGFWPESESYDDKGLGAIPEKFKGECVTGENFTVSHCNRKVIGARYYYQGFEAEMGPLASFGETFFKSARDSDGHGTHTTSTIAGSEVVNASLFGLAVGTARGGAPGARLAVYKACWFNLCSDADVLAAMDDAVSDGVDVLSLSLGPAPPQPAYFSNAISIGAFHAFQRDIVVSCSAGNSFFPGTVTNAAPWILTVAASTVDREFNADVYLGNSEVLKGYSLNPFKMKTSYGLIDGSAAAAPGVSAKNASFCKNNTLDPSLVKGKIVVCNIEVLTDNRREKGLVVSNAGGVGIIIIDPLAKDVGFQILIPATLLPPIEGAKLQHYLATQKYPIGMIASTTTALQTKPAPSMAIFSSAGPNAVSLDIIKPDITAPGVNILAAWSPVATVGTSGRAVDYNIISGTSMSCPHVSAVAAILRAAHPPWSAAAIKSAIMTTGTTFDNTKKLIGRNPNATEATPFDYGSGHVNPIAALNPGLIYDFDSKDIISFLCSTGAGPAELRNLTVGQPLNCPKTPVPSYYFNYPSIAVSNMTGSMSVHRTVTYFGQGPTVYTAYVDYPTGVKVSVIPAQLQFSATGEKLSFRVDFVPYRGSNGSFVFGSLVWSNGVHRVKSPIGVNVVSI